MAIVLRDILIDINHSDFQYKNPVPLNDDGQESIGHAELEHRSDRIYASIYIDTNGSLTELYPKAIVDGNEKLITSIILSHSPNEDLRIERLVDQEIFQASAGADNAELK